MPAPTSAQRVDLLFSNTEGYGWSESYWNIGTVMTGYNAALQNLVLNRADILADNAQIEYIRLQNSYSRSPILLNAQAAGPTPGTAGDEGPDFVSAVIRTTGMFGGIGRIFLRGIPQAQYDGDDFNFDPGYSTAMTTFLNGLVGAAIWAIRTATVQAMRPRYAISNLSPLAPRGYTFTMTTSPPFTAGQFIRVHQAVEVGYNGLKQVVAVLGSSSPYSVQVGGVAPGAPDTGTENPYITLINYTYSQITAAIPERITRRSPGRFFGQRRGRRSTTIPLRR
jgi:hypothetical protein